MAQMMMASQHNLDDISAQQFQATEDVSELSPTLGAQICVVSSSLAESIKTPEGETLPHWIYVHIKHFVTVIQQRILENPLMEKHCNSTSCPSMSVAYPPLPLTSGESRKQLSIYWQDADGKNQNLTAKEYMWKVVEWTSTLLLDPQTFDSETLERNTNVIRAVFRRLFRAFAHTWTHHYRQVVEASSELRDEELLKEFELFVLFILRFNLVSGWDLDPLLPQIRDIQALHYRKQRIKS